MASKVEYTTHPCLNHAPAVSEAAPSKSSFEIIADKLDQHVLGRISAAAQIPFHVIGLLAQVGKIIVRAPVCAFKDWYYAKQKETVVLPAPILEARYPETVLFPEKDNVDEDFEMKDHYGAITFPDQEGEEDLQVNPVITHIASSSEDYMQPVKKDIIAACIIFQRICQNFRDMFCGSRPTSPTFKTSVVNMVTVPMASTFLTQEGYLDYQAIEVNEFGNKREKVSVDQMISKLLPNTAKMTSFILDEEETVEAVKEESNSSKYLSMEDLHQAIKGYRDGNITLDLLLLVNQEVYNNLLVEKISLSGFNFDKLKAMEKDYTEGLVSYELYQLLQTKVNENYLNTL